jgi:hypothetical protein
MINDSPDILRVVYRDGLRMQISWERTRLACCRWGPRHRGLPVRSISESAANYLETSFRRGAETSTRDACAPQNAGAAKLNR